MNFLSDRNLEGYAIQLLRTLANQGWLELFSIRFVMFDEAELAVDSNDRIVWRFAQDNQMILLTANRRMKGIDSLEQTIREENTSTSLPVLTIGSLDRFSDRLSLRFNLLIERIASGGSTEYIQRCPLSFC